IRTRSVSLVDLGLSHSSVGKKSRSAEILLENQDLDIHLFTPVPRSCDSFVIYRGTWTLRSADTDYKAISFAESMKECKTVRFILVSKTRGKDAEHAKLQSNDFGEDLGVQLALKYAHRCQICGYQMILPDQGLSSKVYSFVPQSAPYWGPNLEENMIVLCPTHFEEISHGVFYIDPESFKVVHSNWANPAHNRPILRLAGHEIEQAYLEHHRDVTCRLWFQKPSTEYGDSRMKDRFNLLEEKLGSIQTILNDGENESIEFKASLRWDYDLGKRNTELEHTIARTVAGFMNASGGVLLIGVHDDKSILGLRNDYSTLKKKDRDGFELQIGQVISNFIGRSCRDLVHVRFQSIDSKDICLVYVLPSLNPVYITLKDGKSEFPVRMQNSTQSLGPKDAEEYRRKRWPRLR
ncbi:MAG: hypothetical protein DRI61_13065, partial [Chloroflexi bacterium]